MTNPWLEIPFKDYENHMEKVGQSLILSNIFNKSLNKYEPRSVTVLGASTGNGFQYIDSSITKDVHAIDINPEYLNVLQSKYSSALEGLVTHNCNIEEGLPEISSSDLVFGALIFEYVDFAIALENITPLINPDGIFVVILQKTCSTEFVGDTKYETIKALSSFANEIDADEFKFAAKNSGLQLVSIETIPVSKGKGFVRMDFKLSK